MALDFRFSRPDDHEQIQDVFDDGFVFSRSQLTGEWIPEVEAANGLLVALEGDLIVAALVITLPDAQRGPVPPGALMEYMAAKHPKRTWAMLGPLGIRRTYRGQGLGLRIITQATARFAEYDLHVSITESHGETYTDMAMVEDGHLRQNSRGFTVYRFAG